MSDPFTGRVVWVTEGRSKATVGAFFDALGPQRAAELEIVTTDGAEWIRTVVAVRAPNAEICLDTFHAMTWATKALDEVRRDLWRRLKGKTAAKAIKGLRWPLLRNWANLTVAQRDTIRELETTNRRLFRGWLLKEELADIFRMPIRRARRALDDWLHYASRSRLEPFVRLARTIRHYRDSIEATIEWGFTNGIAEANNSVIGRIRRNANGFHNPNSLHHHDHARPRRPRPRPPLDPMTHPRQAQRPALRGSWSLPSPGSGCGPNRCYFAINSNGEGLAPPAITLVPLND